MAEASIKIGDTVCIITCTSESVDFYRDALNEIAEVAAKFRDSPEKSNRVVDAICRVVSSSPKGPK